MYARHSIYPAAQHDAHSHLLIPAYTAQYPHYIQIGTPVPSRRLCNLIVSSRVIVQLCSTKCSNHCHCRKKGAESCVKSTAYGLQNRRTEHKVITLIAILAYDSLSLWADIHRAWYKPLDQQECRHAKESRQELCWEDIKCDTAVWYWHY